MSAAGRHPQQLHSHGSSATAWYKEERKKLASSLPGNLCVSVRMHGIVECPESEVEHKDHQVQLLAGHRTTLKSDPSQTLIWKLRCKPWTACKGNFVDFSWSPVFTKCILVDSLGSRLSLNRPAQPWHYLQGIQTAMKREIRGRDQERQYKNYWK